MPLMRLLRALLVVALWREARGANIDALLKKAESVDVDALAARAEQGLGIVRRSVGGALSWARAHRQVVSAAAGGGLLFYGKNVGHVLLLAQTFRVTGWPTVKKGTAELVTSYEEASTVIEDEAPNLLAARASLQDVQKKSTAIQATVAKAQASFASGRMTKAALAATVADAKAQMKDVMQQASAAAAALSTVSRVAQVGRGSVGRRARRRLFLSLRPAGRPTHPGADRPVVFRWRCGARAVSREVLPRACPETIPQSSEDFQRPEESQATPRPDVLLVTLLIRTNKPPARRLACGGSRAAHRA